MDRHHTLGLQLQDLTVSDLEGALVAARKSGAPAEARISPAHLLTFGVGKPELRLEWTILELDNSR